MVVQRVGTVPLEIVSGPWEVIMDSGDPGIVSKAGIGQGRLAKEVRFMAVSVQAVHSKCYQPAMTVPFMELNLIHMCTNTMSTYSTEAASFICSFSGTFVNVTILLINTCRTVNCNVLSASDHVTTCLAKGGTDTDCRQECVIT